ncbi:MAG: hypothetical protein GY801_20430 [bacterium]|nr:hypothetical protein [bacterium]
MGHGPEYELVEKPILDILQDLGYEWMQPADNAAAGDSLNNVILKDVLIAALQRINGIDADTARAVYQGNALGDG